jgi:excisionase family DNA binding protein
MIKTRSRYYTTHDIAGMFSVHPKTVRKWIRRGHLGALRLDRQWRISQTEIDRFLEQGRQHGR